MAKKVIISCAVTGAIHTPSMSEFLRKNSDIEGVCIAPVTAQLIITFLAI